MFLSLLLFALPITSALGGVIVERKDKGKKTCTVKARGGKKDDVPNILKAFGKCGHGGTIVFPEDQNYWIAQKLNPVVNNVEIDWKGTWTVGIAPFTHTYSASIQTNCLSSHSVL